MNESVRATLTSEERQYIYAKIKDDMKYLTINDPKDVLLYNRLVLLAEKLHYSPAPLKS